jgi:hypothetical protein
MVQRIKGSRVQGSEVQGSAPPPACKAISQIEKETLKKRISNVEGMYSIYFIKND